MCIGAQINVYTSPNMVIKAESVDMDIKTEKHDADESNHSNHSITEPLSPPPSKRAKLNPPMHPVQSLCITLFLYF